MSERLHRGLHRRLSVLAPVLALVLGACGDRDGGNAPSQVAARVNGAEITVHQLNFLVQRTPGITRDNVAQAQKAAIAQLIDQEMLVQEAARLNLHQDPQVMMMLENARRSVLAHAALERSASAAATPTEAEVGEFFDKHPDLFQGRRIYQFNELTLGRLPDDWHALQGELQKATRMSEAVDILQAHGISAPVTLNVVRPAEHLPLELVPRFSTLELNELVIYPQGPNIVIGEITGIHDAPIARDRAGDAIRNFLRTQEAQRHRTELMDRLRAAMMVEYIGEFAKLEPDAAQAPRSPPGGGPAMSGPASAPAGALPPATGSAPSGGTDRDAIERGLKGLR